MVNKPDELTFNIWFRTSAAVLDAAGSRTNGLMPDHAASTSSRRIFSPKIN
jgi:hypothetical protein